MFKRFNSSSPWVWMSAGLLSLCLIAVLGVVSLIGWKGLSYFWPAPLYEFEIETAQGKTRFYGQIYDREQVPTLQLIEAGVDLKDPHLPMQTRWLIRIGNRENEVHDFISVLKQDILFYRASPDFVVIERQHNGFLYGLPRAYIENNIKKSAKFSHQTAYDFQQYIEQLKSQLDQIKLVQLKRLNHQIKQLEVKNNLDSSQMDKIENLKVERYQLTQKQDELENALVHTQIQILDRFNQPITVSAEQMIDFWFPNQMTLIEKVLHWFQQVKYFVMESPREGHSEGGVFPAIFGTVLMVLLMSIVVMPLGVLAAVYLHEYARKNTFTRLMRIAIVNLAGVPSIVYGVFGLGFFVYFLGGNIDALFYADVMPRPTFGTPGLLWSSLTLAILTLPVVIVSTEEGLARIPMSMRQASFALGATKAETLRQIILPMTSPAMMTGLILAIARAAGEVAPLMLVGVVKIAPTLPFDTHFPYLHLDRKFMHLGYHIYDAGFQSPNSESVRPLVYATSFLLMTVIVSLNLTAISIRHHLREKYRALEQDI